MKSLRESPAIILQRQRAGVSEAIQGREAASSTSLSASFGLPVEQVRALMRLNGVKDDG